MLSSVDRVPQEIWQHIASYLSEKVLRRLISVNRAFYDLVMNKLYRDVVWQVLTIDMLKSISSIRNPQVASRVRTLDLNMSFVHVLYREKRTQLKGLLIDGLPLSYHVRSFKKRWRSRRTRTWIEIDEWMQRLKLHKPEGSSEAIEAALSYMINLTSCYLDMRSFPEIGRPFTDVLFRVLNTTNLTKFTLRCDSTVALDRLITSVRFQVLEELKLVFEFTTGVPHNIREENQEYLSAKLAPWINSLSHTLTSFNLLGPCLAYTHLFRGLGIFPHLSHLTLYMELSPCNNVSPDCTALLSFLRKHNPRVLKFAILPQSSQHKIWADFTSQMMEDPGALARLTLLTISSPPDDFDIIMAYVHRSMDTLEDLIIANAHLSFEHVRTLALAFSSAPSNNLKSLTLDVQVICPAVLDILYRNLPGLESLEIIYRDVGGMYLDSYGLGAYLPVDHNPAPSYFAWNFPPFTRAMTVNRYPDWALSDFSAWAYSEDHRPPGISERQIMFSVADAVPNLGTFAGEPLRLYEYHGMTPH